MRLRHFEISLLVFLCVTPFLSSCEYSVVGGAPGIALPPTTQSNARDAQPNDVKVGIVVDRDNFKTSEKPHRIAIIAFLVNISDTSISVYYPGIAGPIFSSRGPFEAVPLEIRARGNNRSVVVLEPKETIGRVFVIDDDFSNNLALSAYYTIYVSGHEGDVDQISAIVDSDGSISRLKPPRH